MKLKTKKEIIEKLLAEQTYDNDVLIYKLLKNDHLDNLISKLDNKKTTCQSKCIVKKGFLTPEEQFLNLLDNFLTHLNNTFYMLEYTYIYMLVEEMLKSKYCNILFSKHYWGNNAYLEKYQIEFDKIIIEPFITNLQYLTKQYYTSTTHSIQKLIANQKDIDIADELIINKTITFLKDLLLSNPEHLHFTAMHLFINAENYIISIQNKEQDSTEQQRKEKKESLLTFFNDTWTRLYDNYSKKMEKIS